MLALLPFLAVAQTSFTFDHVVAISAVGVSGRSATHTDAVEAAVVDGSFQPPHAGDVVHLPNGRTATWRDAVADKTGNFSGDAFSGGYAFATYDARQPEVMILEAAGHSMVYVNGFPRAGDVYGYGYMHLPVVLDKGSNTFLFATGRGQMSAKLVEPKAPVAFDTADPTLPDFIAGEISPVYAAVVVTNATTRPVSGLTLEARCGRDVRVTWLPTLNGVSVRKVGFLAPSPGPTNTDTAEVSLTLKSREVVLDTAKLTFRVRTPKQSHRRTFVSAIDGSVQYYAVQPAQGPMPPGERPALVLSAHGASVEAQGQADAYGPKSWCHIVAPTNRRPYGFDWEDWGRLDALEVLADAERRYNTDPARTYLTGHSMGGHGTWQLGVHFPDKFAGIAPSAGWISFWTYIGRGAPLYPNPTPVQAILARAVSPGDTLGMAENLWDQSISILHGDADDNVPISEAQIMAKRLDDLGIKYRFDIKKGAGHWWDDADEPGASCVDWPAFFDMFAKRRLADMAEIRHVKFMTVNPEDSASCYWLTIEGQLKVMAPSRVDLTLDPLLHQFRGTTENVSRMALDVSFLPQDSTVGLEIDGQQLTGLYPAGKRLLLARRDQTWTVLDSFDPLLKNARRYGPFKHAFRGKMAFVYSTKGTPEENRWSYAKARFDAETFYYKGNGSVDIIRDTELGASVGKDRCVILYGNADTNAAWSALLAGSPVQVRRGAVKVGDTSKLGEFAVLFLRPRPGSDTALVGVVSGTRLAGMRVTDRLPYFTSGVQYPDVFVVSPAALKSGDGGIACAGFFGEDWSVGKGDFALAADH